MKLIRLLLHAFGPFTDRVLDFGANPGLILIHGRNEAGKSATMRAMADLRFGIPIQSSDNFRHAHPDMRIGGVFIDERGERLGLVRRKGRSGTLMTRDPDSFELEKLAIAPADLDFRLTGGLSRAEYDQGFSLDYERLEAGGKALLAGQGDVGAALFEASAGTTTVKAMLEHLDKSARVFFMPGARGKSGRINELLSRIDEARHASRDALLRPSQWTDLAARHEAARQHLEQLEAQARERHRGLLLVRELRTVLPLLRTLERAQTIDGQLAHIRLLPADAPSRRAAIQEAGRQAQLAIVKADQEIEEYRQQHQRLPADNGLLALAPAIERLGAAAETIDGLLAEQAETGRLILPLIHRQRMQAAAIIETVPIEDLLQRMPAGPARVLIDARLRQMVSAQEAVAQHRLALARLHDETIGEAGNDGSTADHPGPDATARLRLRAVRHEIARHETSLLRLSELAGLIDQARSACQQALASLGLTGSARSSAPRPLLDADIDLMLSQRDQLIVQRDGFRRRIAEMNQAIVQQERNLAALLGEGSITTLDQVLEARAARDRIWQVISPSLGDESAADATRPSNLGALIGGYEAAVQIADRLADALAGDTGRAAKVQAFRQALAMIRGDRDSLAADTQALEDRLEQLNRHWDSALRDAGLPAIAPESLREWQARLAVSQSAQAHLQGLIDEQRRLLALAEGLAGELTEALRDNGCSALPPTAPLNALVQRADELEQMLVAADHRAATFSGRRQQLQRETERLAARESELLRQERDARQALDAVLAPLFLSGGASPEMVMARLHEFESLAQSTEQILSLQARRERADQALALLTGQWQSLAAALVAASTPTGLSRPASPEPLQSSQVSAPASPDCPAPDGPAPDGPALRLAIEGLAGQLRQARRDHGERQLLEQAITTAQTRLAEARTALLRHQADLADCCEQAGARDATELELLEEQSALRRAAQQDLARSAAQLAQATQRPLDELRTLLADRDPLSLEADESRDTLAFSELDETLRLARADEESARRALQAIDSTDASARAAETMESAYAGVRAAMSPWVRSRLAHALLSQATRRFRERAQGPMLQSASGYFQRMTGGEFTRLLSDDSGDHPRLLAQRQQGGQITTDGLSEGTRDQLYLALRLAAIDLRRSAGVDLPLVLDDVLMSSDEHRAMLMLQALTDHARSAQVFVFTHHRHLLELARSCLPAPRLITLDEDASQ